MYTHGTVPICFIHWCTLQVSFNPQDNTQVCVVGEKLFKLFRYSEGNLKQFGIMKIEPSNYLCQAWISEDRLVLGTDNGKVQLFEVGELKNEFDVMVVDSQVVSPETTKKVSQSRWIELACVHVHVCTLYNSMTSNKMPTYVTYGEAVLAFCVCIKKCVIWKWLAQLIITPSTTPLKPVAIDCIITYSKGFICSGGNGTLHLFEKTDDRNVYKKTRSVSIWMDPSLSLVAQSEEEDTGPSNNVLNMTLSPSEENVVCSTRMQQLYNLTLSAADLQGKVCDSHILIPTLLLDRFPKLSVTYMLSHIS